MKTLIYGLAWKWKLLVMKDIGVDFWVTVTTSREWELGYSSSPFNKAIPIKGHPSYQAILQMLYMIVKY